MSVIFELVNNMYHSTPQGFLGVSLIFAYLVLIVAVAMMRIAQNADHH